MTAVTNGAAKTLLTLDAVAAKLDGAVRDDAYVLTGAALEAPVLDDVLAAAGLSALELAAAKIERTDQELSIAGDAGLFDGAVTFAVVDGALAVELRLTYPEDETRQILGLPWAKVRELELTVRAFGPARIIPLVTLTLSGAIELGDKRIDVELAPAVAGGWRLRAGGIPLPDLTTLVGLFPGQDATALTPPALDEVGGFQIVELLCHFDPDDWTVQSLSATVGAPHKEWSLGPGLPRLRDVSLSVGADFDDSEISNVFVGAGATIKLGDLELPVRVVREPWGDWRIGVIGAHGFPSLGELIKPAAGAKAVAALPAGVRELRMDTASLELTLGEGETTLKQIEFAARLADWPIIDGLTLEGVELQLRIDRVADDTSGSVAGVIRLGDTRLPVLVRKPGGSQPWTLSLGASATPLGGFSSLAGLVGGDDLPAGFGDGVLTLRDLTMVFDPAKNTLDKIAIELHSAGPWSLPELSQFDVRDITLKLEVADPGDAAKRAVTGMLAGVVDLAGPAIRISASKPTRTAEWQLEGTLLPGMPLDLTVLATRALGGQLALPAEVPSLALTTADLKLTPATGAFGLKAGSEGPWSVPLGFAGVTLSAIELDLARARSGADLKGSLSGRFRIAEFELRVAYQLPGDLVLAGHIETLRLAALVEELAGPGLVDTLALPAEFKALELHDVDFSLAPTQGRFFAAARVPGFETAGFLLAKQPAGDWGFALALAPDDSWRLSSLGGALSALDDLSFDRTVLVISTADDASGVAELPVVRKRLGEGVKAGRGLTFIADLALDGTGAEHVLDRSTLRVRAAIESVDKLMLEAELGGPFPLGDGVVLQEVDFRLRVASSEFELGLLARIDVVLDPTSRLSFIGGLSVTPNKLSAAVTMLGTWDQPFGVNGVSISDVALQLDWSYQGLPGIGIAGSMKIGDFLGSAALKFDAENPSKSMVMVLFNALKLGDLLAQLCAEVLGDAVDPEIVRSVFDISFKDVEIYIVPQDTRIGELSFKQGTRLKARMFFWGLEADARVEVDYQKGLLIDGQLDPIVFGDVFSLTGVEGYPKPRMYLEVGESKPPAVDIQGQVELLGLSREIQIRLTDSGFYFEIGGKLFDLFECTLVARGGHLGDTNGFYVEATMDNHLLEYLREHAVEALRRAARDADAGIADALRAVEAAREEISSFDTRIEARRATVLAERAANQQVLAASQTSVVEEKQRVVADLNHQIDDTFNQIRAARERDTEALLSAQRDVQDAQRKVDSILAEIETTRAVIRGERDLANRRMNSAQADVDAAQREVDSILAKIRDNERWWNGLPDIDVPWNESKTREAVWYYPMIGGLYTGYGTATGVLKGYREVLEGIKLGANTSPIDGDPRIVALYTGYGPATGALEAAKGILEASKAIQTAPPIEADPSMLALYASRETAQAALDIAIGGLTAIQTAADVLPVDMDPEIVSLMATRDLSLAGLYVAEGTLQVTRTTVAGALQVSEYIVNYGLGGLFDVTHASFAGGIDAVSGGEVRLEVDVKFLDEPSHFGFEFNFNDLERSVENLVKELVPA